MAVPTATHFPSPRCLCHSLLTLLLAAAPAPAQLKNLATDETGERVYFSSALRQYGTAQPFHSKIFVFDSAGLWLFEARERTDGPLWTNAYNLVSISASGDNKVVALNGDAQCLYGGSSCFLANKRFAEIQGPDFRTGFAGNAQLSANGAWALYCCQNGVSSFGVQRQRLAEGSPAQLGREPAAGGRWIADNGTALVRLNEGMALVDTAGAARFLPFTQANWVEISANGSQVIVELPDGRMNMIATSGGLPRDRGEGRRPALSRDANWMIFLTKEGQLAHCHTAACIPRVLTAESAPVVEAVLSGDGRVAYALTATGRLLRIDTASGEQVPYLSEPPEITSAITEAVPGSTLALAGRFPAHASARLLIGEREVAPWFASPAALFFQIPWDVVPGGTPVRLLSGDIPWEALAASSVADVAPQLAAAAHEDFRGLVTLADPARPGEILHRYLTGLGPVAPSPAAPLARCVLPWRAVFEPGTEAEILYAGLAPGFPGFYQLDLRAPSRLADSPSFLMLRMGERVFDLGAVPVQLP